MYNNDSKTNKYILNVGFKFFRQLPFVVLINISRCLKNRNLCWAWTKLELIQAYQAKPVSAKVCRKDVFEI